MFNRVIPWHNLTTKKLNMQRRNFPVNVYDAATWSAITPLSERSIALGNQTVEFPDFTGGKWMYEKPVFSLGDAY